MLIFVFIYATMLLEERSVFPVSRTVMVGRAEECRKLERCVDRQQAQLVTVYGRRRVGKTFLINEFFDKRFDFKLTGEYKASKESQLENFILEWNRRTKSNHAIPDSWKEAFSLLREYLSSLPTTEKHIVFFDEMPWMDTPNSGFLPSFEYFWNDYGSACDHLIFIICGSSTSWMMDHIERNKGGLFNRRTCKILLEPFSLLETELYLKSLGIEWARYDIAEMYMITGGIPYYLSFLTPDLSLSENIDNLFFQKGAELRDEFDHLFRTLFENSELYIRIVETLSKKKSGMGRAELAEKAGIPVNGCLTKKLSNLVDAGFVRASSFYNQKKRDIQYQLSDYYTLFYFRFVKDHYGQDEHYWSNAVDLPSRRVWAGLTFEQLCRDHSAQIKQQLGIAGVLSEESVWFSRCNEEGSSRGAQIDLVIDRRDHTTTLCEMKYSVNVFEIDKDYEIILRNKIDAFRRETGTKKSLQLALITTFGVKKNKYSNIVARQVVLDDLFT